MEQPTVEKQYPIAGYAPGTYQCKCSSCKNLFIGDKRAVQCEPCAIKTDKLYQFTKYLMDKGFEPGLQSTGVNTLYYFKNDIGVMIAGVAVDFGEFNTPDANGVRQPGCKLFASYTGIDRLDLPDWKMLLHVAKVVLMDFEK